MDLWLDRWNRRNFITVQGSIQFIAVVKRQGYKVVLILSVKPKAIQRALISKSNEFWQAALKF